MALYQSEALCPQCNKINTVDFMFSHRNDVEEETEHVSCECGCEFDITCDAFIQYETGMPKNINKKDS